MLEELLQRPHRRAPQDFSTADVLSVKDSALSSDNCIGIEPRVFSNPDLPSQDRVRTDGRTPGNSRLGCDNSVFADFHVVRDLDEIIQFRAAPHNRGFQRTAVDAGVRSDFDIVFDDHAANLRELDVAVPILHKAESIGSDHSARVDDHIVSDFHVGIDRDTRMQHTPVTDPHTFSNHAPGPDRGSLADNRAGLDNSGRMNGCARSCAFLKPFCAECERQLRVRHNNHSLTRKVSTLDKNAARPAGPRFRMKLFLCITKVGRTCIPEAGHRLQDGISTPFELPSKKLSDLQAGLFHDALRKNSDTAEAVLSPCSIHAGTETPWRKLPVTNRPGMRDSAAAIASTRCRCPMLY